MAGGERLHSSLDSSPTKKLTPIAIADANAHERHCLELVTRHSLKPHPPPELPHLCHTINAVALLPCVCSLVAS
jgi:hypothetical protein